MMTIGHPIYMEKYLNQNILDYFTTTGFVCFCFGGRWARSHYVGQTRLGTHIAT